MLLSTAENIHYGSNTFHQVPKKCLVGSLYRFEELTPSKSFQILDFVKYLSCSSTVMLGMQYTVYIHLFIHLFFHYFSWNNFQQLIIASFYIQIFIINLSQFFAWVNQVASVSRIFMNPHFIYGLLAVSDRIWNQQSQTNHPYFIRAPIGSRKCSITNSLDKLIGDWMYAFEQ